MQVPSENNIPFGPLLNAAKYSFLLDGREWGSVIEFVSNIGGVQYTIVPPYDISLDDLWEHLKKERINKAIMIALEEKINKSTEFHRALLTNESQPYVYNTNNAYLGKSGENVYGKWLTSYRNVAIDTNGQMFYDIYRLHRLLNVAITYQPLDKYLKLIREQGYGVRDLIVELEVKDGYGKFIDFPSREVLDQLKQTTVREWTHRAEELVVNVLKSRLRSVRASNMHAFKHKLLVDFVSRIVRREGYDYVPSKFVRDMDSNDREYAAERLYDYYKSHPLEAPNIQPDVYIPTEEYVSTIEALEVDRVKPVVGRNVEVNEYDTLGMKNDSVGLYIDDRTFPSIWHYMIYYSGGLIPDIDPYWLIVRDGAFLSHDECQANLERVLQEYWDHRLYQGLRAALDSKFMSHGYLRDLLLYTDDSLQLTTNELKRVYTTRSLREIRSKLPIEVIMSQRGSILDDEEFMRHNMYEMNASLRRIASVIDYTNTSEAFRVDVYKHFYDNIPGTLLVDYSGGSYIENKMIRRLLTAERLAREWFQTDAVYATKAVIFKARDMMTHGDFINPKMKYTPRASRVAYALAKAAKNVSSVLKGTVVSKSHLDKAYMILDMALIRLQGPQQQDDKKDAPLDAVDYVPEEPDEEVEVGDVDDDNDDQPSQYGGSSESDDDEVLESMYAPGDAEMNVGKMIKALMDGSSEDTLDHYRELVRKLEQSGSRNMHLIHMLQ